MAATLAIHQDELNGKITLIFQAAEEIGTGAKTMINEDVLNDSDPEIDAIFGFHNYPSMAVGKIAVRDGVMFAGINRFLIKINGRGESHTHHPEGTLNLIYPGNDIIREINQVPAELNLSSETLIITTNLFHAAGEGNNAIPDLAMVNGSIRALNKKIKDSVKCRVCEIIEKQAENYGTAITFEEKFSCLSIVNHENETALLKEVAIEQLGEDNVILLKQPFLAYDDFAYFADKIPGCYFLIGNGEQCPMVHTSTYDFCDAIIPLAAHLLCEIVKRMQVNDHKKIFTIEEPTVPAFQ